MARSEKRRHMIRALPGRFTRQPLRRALVAAFASLAGVLACAADGPTTAIKMDQVGYPLNGSKVALVAYQAKTFDIREVGTNRVVYHGPLGPARFDPAAGDTVEPADFSSLKQEGKFVLDVPGVGKSWAFTVGRNVYERAYFLAMRGFYGQRCGTAVDLGPEFPGFAHPACHLHGAFQILFAWPNGNAVGPWGNCPASRQSTKELAKSR